MNANLRRIKYTEASSKAKSLKATYYEITAKYD
jgi:hypothetical protein